LDFLNEKLLFFLTPQKNTPIFALSPQRYRFFSLNSCPVLPTLKVRKIQEFEGEQKNQLARNKYRCI